MKTICKHAYPSDLCGICNPPAKEKPDARFPRQGTPRFHFVEQLIMTKTLKNHDIPTAWWETQFSRDELRHLAAAHGIKRGRDKHDSAINLKNGKRLDGTIATFTVFCKITSLQNAKSAGDPPTRTSTEVNQ